jgi:hypothetical protein
MAGQKQLATLDEALDGDVVVPDEAAYDEVRKSPWAQYAHVRPLAVARCRTPADVAEAIAYARRERLPLAIRSGGHCFAGRSTMCSKRQPVATDGKASAWFSRFRTDPIYR